MRNPARDLVEALFQIGGNGEDVARVAQRHLLAQIDADLVVIRRVERRDAADALRPEAGAGAIGGAAVERDADHRCIVFRDIAHILHIGRLQEGVDPGEMRQLARARKSESFCRSGIRRRAGPCRATIAAPCARPCRKASPPPPATSSLRWPACRNRDGGGASARGADEGRPCAKNEFLVRKSWK